MGGRHANLQEEERPEARSDGLFGGQRKRENEDSTEAGWINPAQIRTSEYLNHENLRERRGKGNCTPESAYSVDYSTKALNLFLSSATRSAHCLSDSGRDSPLVL